MPDSQPVAKNAVDIEARIAAALVRDHCFHDRLTAAELSIILSNVIFALIAMQKVAGLEVGLEHRVQQMDVQLRQSIARVGSLVEIFKPIKARLGFSYELENDPAEPGRGLRLRANTLRVEQSFRRFDVRARAALAVLDVQKMAERELADVRQVIRRTLPPQLQRHRVDGAFTNVRLKLVDDRLDVYLEGEFAPLLPAD